MHDEILPRARTIIEKCAATAFSVEEGVRVILWAECLCRGTNLNLRRITVGPIAAWTGSNGVGLAYRD